VSASSARFRATFHQPIRSAVSLTVKQPQAMSMPRMRLTAMATVKTASSPPSTSAAPSFMRGASRATAAISSIHGIQTARIFTRL